MQDLKALGADGPPALFYKKYWHIVGNSVVDDVQNLFLSSKMLTELNNTLIVLISKTQSSSSFNHFLLISLCNTVYKIIAKLIVFKIRPLLNKMIASHYFVFIIGRWIAENQVLEGEIVIASKRKLKGGLFVAMKVELLKAYDKVDWRFL